MCTLHSLETVEHMMVECPAYEGDPREVVIGKLRDHLDISDYRQMLESEDRGVGYMLGLEGGFSSEVIEAVKVYLCKIWAIRREGSAEARESLEYPPVEHIMHLGQESQDMDS